MRRAQSSPQKRSRRFVSTTMGEPAPAPPLRITLYLAAEAGCRALGSAQSGYPHLRAMLRSSTRSSRSADRKYTRCCLSPATSASEGRSPAAVVVGYSNRCSMDARIDSSSCFRFSSSSACCTAIARASSALRGPPPPCLLSLMPAMPFPTRPCVVPAGAEA